VRRQGLRMFGTCRSVIARNKSGLEQLYSKERERERERRNRTVKNYELPISFSFHANNKNPRIFLLLLPVDIDVRRTKRKFALDRQHPMVPLLDADETLAGKHQLSKSWVLEGKR